MSSIARRRRKRPRKACMIGGNCVKCREESVRYPRCTGKRGGERWVLCAQRNLKWSVVWRLRLRLQGCVHAAYSDTDILVILDLTSDGSFGAIARSPVARVKPVEEVHIALNLQRGPLKRIYYSICRWSTFTIGRFIMSNPNNELRRIYKDDT